MSQFPVSVKDVVGLLPDGGGLIVVAVKDKYFPIKCSGEDANACRAAVAGADLQTPYHFLSSTLRAAGMEILETKLIRAGSQLYSVMYLKCPSRSGLIKICSDNPAGGIVSALLSRCPLSMDGEVVDKLVDSRDAYACLVRAFGKLWPMERITETDLMKTLSDYMDEALPRGSIFHAKSP